MRQTAAAMRSELLLPLLLGIASAAMHTRRRRVEWILRIYNFTNCPDQPGAVNISKFVVHMDRGGQQRMDAELFASKGTRRFNEMRVTSTVCKDSVSYNTCEKDQTWSWKTALCELIATPNMVWSTFTDSMEPHLRCPFHKGHYALRNFTLDSSLLAKLGVPLKGHVFAARTEFYDERNDLFMCDILEFEVKQAAIHSWS